MTENNQCPKCGVDVPQNAPAGMCLKCLMAAGLDDSQPSLGSELAPTSVESQSKTGPFIPPAAESLGPHFPQLEISKLIGHGGMGAVYKARQKKLDRNIALKIIRPQSTDDQTFAERFSREARALARLSHSHIVTIHDFGEVTIDSSGNDAPRTLYYFLMEYVDGANLRQVIEGGELQPEQAFAVVPQICDALQYAHDQGVVHRDIKPENILIDQQGQVKIVDFGLAKLSSGSGPDERLTGTHQVMGTPRYMAPEQMEGTHAVDHRADIYSLGVVFYEMLTGQIPAGHFAPPSEKVHIDVRLDEVVLRTLSSEPDRRYQRVSEVKDDVDSIVKDGQGAQSPSSQLGSQPCSPSRSQPLSPSVSSADGSSKSNDSSHSTDSDKSKFSHLKRSEWVIVFAAVAVLLSSLFGWHSTQDAGRLDGDQVFIGAINLDDWQFGVIVSQTPLSLWQSTLAFRERSRIGLIHDWFLEIPNVFLLVVAGVLIGITAARCFAIFPAWVASVTILFAAAYGMLHAGMVTCALMQELGQLRLPPFLMFIGFGLVVMAVLFQAVASAIGYAITRDVDLQLRVSGYGLLLTGIAAVLFGLGYLILFMLVWAGVLNDRALPRDPNEASIILGICIALMLLGSVVIRGARAILNRSSLTWALTASAIGQPIGLWALWILRSRDVRESFSHD